MSQGCETLIRARCIKGTKTISSGWQLCGRWLKPLSDFYELDPLPALKLTDWNFVNLIVSGAVSRRD
jgi:hypothetical protein